MNTIRISRYAISVIGVALLSSGCDGSQPPIGTPDAVMRSQATAMDTYRGRSWMLPESATSTNGDIIYVSTSSGVVLVAYPQGTILNTLPIEYTADTHVCADSNNGNVFITAGHTIYEYPHGGTTQSGELHVPSTYSAAAGCSVDPNTHDLAVVVQGLVAGNGALFVYANAQGNPTVYSHKHYEFSSVTYDSSDNVFMTGERRGSNPHLFELRSKKRNILMTKTYLGFLDKVVWDGSYLAALVHSNNTYLQTLDQLSVTAQKVTVVNTITLDQALGDSFWVQGNVVIAPYGVAKSNNDRAVAVWNYPAGGDATAEFYGVTKGRRDVIIDMTMSPGVTKRSLRSCERRSLRNAFIQCCRNPSRSRRDLSSRT